MTLCEIASAALLHHMVDYSNIHVYIGRNTCFNTLC